METRLYLAGTEALTEPSVFAEALRRAPAARRKKIARLRDARSKRLSLGAWLLLEHALGDAGLSAGELCLGAHGKPCLASRPALCFSLSHSGERVLCAVSDAAIGCDVELRRPVDPALARRFFHPDEAAALDALPASKREEAFFRLWTLKESVLKATGDGLTRPLSSFAICLDGGQARLAPDAGDWRLLSLLDGDYALALCAEALPRAEAPERITL